jgi:protein-L-isoaspartate(D-aspartate) O-methyltransferase
MTVDRRQFTPDGSNPPHAVPIGYEQTVPTEHVVDLLLRLCNTNGRVLEIGTGSGYQAAVLAEHCQEVVTIEINPICGIAEKLPSNVVMLAGYDGRTYDTGEEFDAVLVTFASPELFPVWRSQLKDGGRLVVPLKSGAFCSIRAYDKIGGCLELVDVAAYAPFTDLVRESDLVARDETGE